MIDISRGLKLVSLPVDFAQTAWENWKLLPFSIKVLQSLSKKVWSSIKVVYLCISRWKHSFGAKMFHDFTVLRWLKSQNILQIPTNRTEKSKWHMIGPKKHRIQEKEYINFTNMFYIDFPFLVTKMIVRSHVGVSWFNVFTLCLNLYSMSCL
jgi:hypothetical protein